jgi:glycosyltransferase involved in cell wall biosynthesis
MLFSVIIPTYNRANELRRCLKSLVSQTIQEFEVIVCDDGSTDDTKEVIQEFQGLLNLKYTYSTNFGGPAQPRNSGLKIANGEFIAFLDSDDWWYPNKLKLSLNSIKDFDIVYHDLDKYCSEKRNKGIVKGRPLLNNKFTDLVMNGNGIPNSSVVVRKCVIDKIGYFSEDRNLIAVEDADYWIRISTITNKFIYIPKSLGAYWVGQTISASAKQIRRENYLLNKYINDLLDHEKTAARRLLAFRNARTYHDLRMFKKAKVNYHKALLANSLVIRIKSIIGISICNFYLSRKFNWIGRNSNSHE